jgi:formiminoglutamase
MGAKLPIVVSVPHGGTRLPKELMPLCLLSPIDFVIDGDTWSRQIYDVAQEVNGYLAADFPRAIVDVNRSPEDSPPQNPDGVVKTVTVQGKQVWHDDVVQNDKSLADQLIATYHSPYHARLHELCLTKGAVLGLDCHTMLAISPKGDQLRPSICVSNRGNKMAESVTGPCTAPAELVRDFAVCLKNAFHHEDLSVNINDPFFGGYVSRHQASQGPVPWIQLEISRGLYIADENKVTIEPDEKHLKRIADIRKKLLLALDSLLD